MQEAEMREHKQTWELGKRERFGVGGKRLIVDSFVVVEQGSVLLGLRPVAMGTSTVVPQPFPYSTTTNDKENIIWLVSYP